MDISNSRPLGDVGACLPLQLIQGSFYKKKIVHFKKLPRKFDVNKKDKKSSLSRLLGQKVKRSNLFFIRSVMLSPPTPVRGISTKVAVCIAHVHGSRNTILISSQNLCVPGPGPKGQSHFHPIHQEITLV